MVQRYNKAIVAVAGAVVAVAAAFGTDIDPVLVNSIVGALTALTVFLVPNKP